MDESPRETEQESPGVGFAEFGRAGPVAIVAALMPAAGGFLLLIFMPKVAHALNGLGTMGLLVYIMGFAIASGLALLPTYAQALLGGYTFGLALGVPGAIAGLLLGSFIGYFMARRLTGDDVVAAINKHPKWKIVLNDFFPDAAINGPPHGFWRTLGIITLIRFPPNSPFALTNLALASVKVRLVPFGIGTAVGMLPRTALVVWLGTLIHGELSKDAIGAAKPKWLLPVGIGVSILVLFILARIGDLAIRRAAGREREALETLDASEAE
ncbi:MAG TPA: TVP38/TMEM64 family protein [Phycisphaerales bacterium]|nr:TVP38/TMEM64 family protein [Phycisphaerales bacterium]